MSPAGGEERAAMRVGVVGAGRHATNSLYPALRPAGLELVAVATNHREQAEAAARAFGGSAGYGSVADMVGGEDLDGVIVCLPPATYVDVVVPLLAAGLPVFCEKPGGGSVADLVTIEAAAAEAGQPVMVGYMKRFAPAYRAAKERIGADGFGPVTSVHAQFLMGPGFGSFTNYVIDNPVHHLDLLRWVGGDVADVHVVARSHDDNRHALALALEFESGAVGTAQFTTTYSWNHEGESLEVVGMGPSVRVANVDTVTYREPGQPAQVSRPSYTVPLPANMTPTTMGFVPELGHFRQVVQDGVACDSDVTSARRTLELAERILAAAG